jgi:hypothetical protein
MGQLRAMNEGSEDLWCSAAASTGWSVELGADLPDLAGAAGDDADAAHADHGVGEVLPEVGPEEVAEQAGVGVDDVDGGRVVVERGVGADDGEAVADVAEDGGVEDAPAAAVQRQPRVEVPRRAPGLELRQEPRRDGRVRAPAAAGEREVVQPVLQEEARGRAHRVRRGEEDEVLLVQAVGAELGAERADAVVHVRQRVGVAQVRHLPVAPPRRHVERRPAGLPRCMSSDSCIYTYMYIYVWVYVCIYII